MAFVYDSLQFVTFTGRPSTRTAVDLWQSAFGAMPDNFQKLPMGSGSQASGLHGGLQFALTVQQNRIDVFIRADDNNPGSLGTVSQPPDAINRGSSILKKLSLGEQIVRPAVVFQTSEEAPSQEDSVAKALSLLPGNLAISSKAIDVSFHADVPFPSTVDSRVVIRRIYRVASGRRVAVQIDLANPGNTFQQPGAFVATQYVDIFAAPDTPIDTRNFDSLVDEIVNEAQVILSNGYVHLS